MNTQDDHDFFKISRMHPYKVHAIGSQSAFIIIQIDGYSKAKKINRVSYLLTSHKTYDYPTDMHAQPVSFHVTNQRHHAAGALNAFKRYRCQYNA